MTGSRTEPANVQLILSLERSPTLRGWRALALGRWLFCARQSETGQHTARVSPRLLAEQDLGDRSASHTWLKHESWGVAGPPRGRAVPLVDDGTQRVEVSPYE